jgi:hypothetical protein
MRGIARCFSGWITIIRLGKTSLFGLDSSDVRIGLKINERVPCDSTVLTNARGMNPV